MFPLGMVLFPGQILPLHVFEPRYRAMVQDCLAGDQHFGVVLIERGSEVGGQDVRTDVGTRARILESEELPDGRWVLATVGVPIAEDPASGSFHIAALAPIGPLDQQRLLAAPGPLGRLELATELLTDEVHVLTQRLAMG